MPSLILARVLRPRRLGDDHVASHHGSLSKERRTRVESQLRAGELRARIDGSNLMVKVPATKAGIPAIATLVGEGININATEQLPYSGSMLTRDENIVNVDLRVQFRRTDAQKFMFNMREPENTLIDATASAIREVIGRNVLDFILTEGRTEIARETQELLQATLDAYGAGITVYEVNLQDANFPREVESSVQDSIKAREDRERRILEAQSYSNEILPRARGDAAARRQSAEAYRAEVIANAEGESDRFTQILAQYQRAPVVTRERIYLETLEAILARSTKVFVDTKGGNNLLYLPLEQLVQRRAAAERGVETSAGVTAVAPAPNSSQRSRERETR